jgi:hypothetical protein
VEALDLERLAEWTERRLVVLDDLAGELRRLVVDLEALLGQEASVHPVEASVPEATPPAPQAVEASAPEAPGSARSVHGTPEQNPVAPNV